MTTLFNHDHEEHELEEHDRGLVNEANKIATSQVALPQDACDAVYATEGYEQSMQNMTQVSLTRDNVFGEDGGAQQLGTMSGSVSEGYTVALTVPVNA